MFVKNMFSKISDDTILWRYLSFPKFLDILETSSLYFRRIDCFDDKREATQPDGSLRFAQLTENPWQVFSFQCVEQQLEIIKNMTYACCWHINTQENIDMWKNYATNKENEGVAIRTSFRDLSECFETEKTLTNLKMKYIEYKTEFRDYSAPNYLEYLSIKDKRQFEYENEMRIVTIEDHYPQYNPDINDALVKTIGLRHKGERIGVNLNRLIQALYLCPNSTETFYLKNEEALKKHGVQTQIITSKLTY